MKVIKPGKYSKICTCFRCEAELQYDEKDVIVVDFKNHTAIMVDRYIVCPECGAIIYLDQSLRVERIQYEL